MKKFHLLVICSCSIFICLNILFRNIIHHFNRRSALGISDSYNGFNQVASVPSIPSQVTCSPNFLNPPKLTENEREHLKSLSQLNSSSEALSTLSAIVQEQIRRINSRKCSDGRKLLCGHYNGDCGFGCQFHHRAACVMISYAMNIPLIHDSKNAWSYSTPWNDIFEPLGSNCTPDNQTFHWTWSHSVKWYRDQRENRKSNNSLFNWNPCNTSDLSNLGLDYPLAKGIVADKELEDHIERYTSKPDKWWIGQFVGYGFRLNPAATDRLNRDKLSPGISSNCIGLHIRRTDKVTEYNDSFHDLSEYFNIVYDKTSSNESQSLPQVYLASDDPEVYQEAKHNYPDIKISGFPMKPGYSRSDTLYESIRDIALLHSCRHIVCGFSSNMCRLLLEMLHYSDHLNADSRLTSLEGGYMYILSALNVLSTSVNSVLQ